MDIKVDSYVESMDGTRTLINLNLSDSGSTESKQPSVDSSAKA